MDGVAKVLTLGTPAQVDDLIADVCAEIGRREEANRRIWTAIMVSRSLEICEALIRGETVPVHRLDQDWMRRLGMRIAA